MTEVVASLSALIEDMRKAIPEKFYFFERRRASVSAETIAAWADRLAVLLVALRSPKVTVDDTEAAPAPRDTRTVTELARELDSNPKYEDGRR